MVAVFLGPARGSDADDGLRVGSRASAGGLQTASETPGPATGEDGAGAARYNPPAAPCAPIV